MSSTSRTACAAAELPPQPGLLERFEALRRQSHPWLLDSALPSERLGRYSFAGADPYLVLRAFGDRVELDCRRCVRPDLPLGCSTRTGDPLEIVRGLLPAPPDSTPVYAPPFVGGAVGYLGYELAQNVESLTFHTLDDLALPDVALLFVDRVLSFDRARGVLCAWALGFGEDAARAGTAARNNLEAFEAILSAPSETPPRPARTANASEDAGSQIDPASYIKAVDCVLEEIAAGNVYQACLTHRMERAYEGDAWSLYQRLRLVNPAPFASFIGLPEVSILSSSPERFLELSAERVVESRPIKGTRPRGRGSADAAFERELESSAKDRAENLMIVDLVRNDLGRVCEIGSISVPELMAIERYASVFQMVSTVRGRLRADCDAFDLVGATFPPGSMTGAPKIAAIQLCDRLERVRRGVYSGAIGYFDARGGADLSVAIRLILLAGGRAFVHSGGGIVADSRPAEEYAETLDKIRPLLAALVE